MQENGLGKVSYMTAGASYFGWRMAWAGGGILRVFGVFVTIPSQAPKQPAKRCELCAARWTLGSCLWSGQISPHRMSFPSNSSATFVLLGTRPQRVKLC